MSTSSSLTSEAEKQHFSNVAAEASQRRRVSRVWDSVVDNQLTSLTLKSKRRKNVIIAVAAVLVVAVALAVGLGVGLTRNEKIVAENQLPTAGTSDDRAGLLQNGSYFTSYADDSVQFVWTENNFPVTSGAPSSSTSSKPVIFINGSDVGQTMDGFGASLTDSSAQLFATLKSENLAVYNSVLDTIFNRRNGINILRVPIGSTDFSPNSLQYTLADQEGQQASVNDTIGPLSHFNMDGANRYIISLIKDALIRNGDLKISLLPWSPPAWMKTADSVNGGGLVAGDTSVLTEYLVKSVQGFKDALGITPWALSVQNEPTNPTAYPSMSLDTSDESTILGTLRGRLAQEGLGSVQLWGHEDNYALFENAATLVNSNASSVDGIAWHCYNGSSSLLSNYTALAMSAKSMHMSECSGQSDNGKSSSYTYSLQWWMNNIFSQPAQGISSITVWNLALNQDYGPRLSRAYCKNCVGSVEISSKAKVTSNVQMLLLSHHATAASNLTRFGGESASRLGTSVSGDSNYCIKSTLAFSARWDDSNSQRVGLVLQNVCQYAVNTTINVNNEHHFDFNAGNGVTSVVLTV